MSPPLTPAESEALCRDMLAAALARFIEVTGARPVWDTADSPFAFAGEAITALIDRLAAAEAELLRRLALVPPDAPAPGEPPRG